MKILVSLPRCSYQFVKAFHRSWLSGFRLFLLTDWRHFTYHTLTRVQTCRTTFTDVYLAKIQNSGRMTTHKSTLQPNSTSVISTLIHVKGLHFSCLLIVDLFRPAIHENLKWRQEFAKSSRIKKIPEKSLFLSFTVASPYYQQELTHFKFYLDKRSLRLCFITCLKPSPTAPCTSYKSFVSSRELSQPLNDGQFGT
jgi:hypothetical protein